MTVFLLISHRDGLVNMKLLDFDRFYQLQLLSPFPILDASLDMGQVVVHLFLRLGGGQLANRETCRTLYPWPMKSALHTS
jgi:hypothetical protein